jgi:superfamily II DNA helicase RecQ
MGQNWRGVRQVVYLGQGDQSLIGQVIGRAGQDGQPALAVLFMETNRKGGQKELNELPTGPYDSNETQMDALALTPVCLQVALGVDNL